MSQPEKNLRECSLTTPSSHESSHDSFSLTVSQRSDSETSEFPIETGDEDVSGVLSS